MLATCFVGSVAPASSYYDTGKPCSAYKALDYPVTAFPWDDDPPSKNCGWFGAVQGLRRIGELPIVESVEASVAAKIKVHREYQMDMASALQCCADAITDKKQKCIEDSDVAQFCGDPDSPSSPFRVYLGDLNERLKALRIATARLTQETRSIQPSTLGIETPKPMLASIASRPLSEVFSIVRMPSLIQGLTKEEAAIADLRLHGQPSDFKYAAFISDDASKDYFTLLGSAPLLGEVYESTLTPKRLSQLLGEYIARNKDLVRKGDDVSYQDFEGLVSNAVKAIPPGESQRQICRYAEFRLKMERAGVTVVKGGIAMAAMVAGAAKGVRTTPMKPGVPIVEVLKSIGTGIGVTSGPAMFLIAGVDLLRSKQLDDYCKSKLFDHIDRQVPLCDEAAVFRTIDDVQTGIVAAGVFSGGMMAFKGGRALKTRMSKPKTPVEP